MRKLNIVVTCSDRKSLPVHPRLRVRDLRAGPVHARVEAWRTRLTAQRDRRPLLELYQGEHWSVARELTRAAGTAGYQPQLWVVSAGLGLQPVDKPWPAYAATFTGRQSDTVGDHKASRAEWWEHLQGTLGEGSLSALGEGSSLLLALSSDYAEALDRDLQALSGIGDVLLIGGSRDVDGVPRLAAQGHLRSALGGTMTSLNVRMARGWLQRCDGGPVATPSRLKQWIYWADGVESPAVPNRASASDLEIQQFIAERSVGPGKPPSRSALLRALRDGGRACEQSRFRALYEEVFADA